MINEFMNWYFGFEASDIIAFFAAVLSLVALGVTIWQGCIQRKHNVLSVKPIVESEFSLYKNEDIIMVIANYGLGAAILKKIRVIHNGIGYEYKQDTLKNIFKENGVFFPVCDTAEANANTCLPAGKEVELFKFHKSSDEKFDHDDLVKFIETLNFEIQYECLYGSKHTVFHSCA